MRLKFEHLPEHIPQSEAIERLENFLTPYLTDDILLNQTEVEPKKEAKLKRLMFSRAAKCSKIGTFSAEINQYVSIPGSPEIETDSFTWSTLKRSILEASHSIPSFFTLSGY